MEAHDVAGVAVPGTMLAVASLHAAWALGWYFPARTEQELARYVLSAGERERLDGGIPPAALTGAVAVALGAAGGIVRALAVGRRSRLLRRLGWGVAGVFAVRGVAYLPSELPGGPDDAYERLDLAVYSPLCLVLAAGTVLVLRRTATTDLTGDDE